MMAVQVDIQTLIFAVVVCSARSGTNYRCSNSSTYVCCSTSSGPYVVVRKVVQSRLCGGCFVVFVSYLYAEGLLWYL
jgi:hypothetical protein